MGDVVNNEGDQIRHIFVQTLRVNCFITAVKSCSVKEK